MDFTSPPREAGGAESAGLSPLQLEGLRQDIRIAIDNILSGTGSEDQLGVVIDMIETKRDDNVPGSPAYRRLDTLHENLLRALAISEAGTIPDGDEEWQTEVQTARGVLAWLQDITTIDAIRAVIRDDDDRLPAGVTSQRGHSLRY